MRILALLTFMIFMISFTYKMLLPDPIQNEAGEVIAESSFLNEKEIPQAQLSKQLQEIEDFKDQVVARAERKEELADMKIILTDLRELWEEKLFAPKYNLSDLRTGRLKISKMKSELGIELNNLDSLEIEQILYLLIEERMSLEEVASQEMINLQTFLNLTDIEWMNLNEYLDSDEFTKKVFAFKGIDEKELPPKPLEGVKIGRATASELPKNDFGAKLKELDKQDTDEEGTYYDDIE
ncbi:MAG: hypothetical protein EP326_06380 [Deltaproteobacteria bacterium]|jgi:hypothetical protein|nr:MAG: hypothetical protein EP326_06380 [Deltaproteobacteria bacterium]TNF26029.1 MAG: hypothetical protein EP319_14755 [Deltaproteobacteria bacterium]